MRIAIIYDSYFGNTKMIAETMAQTISNEHDVYLCHFDELNLDRLEQVELIVVGSPTRAFRHTKKISELIYNIIPVKKIPNVAVFDTRIALEDIDNKMLAFMAKKFGYANDSMAKLISKRGLNLISRPGEFQVADSQGPLKDGEIERAAQWINTVMVGLK